jgi:hypothetical protein
MIALINAAVPGMPIVIGSHERDEGLEIADLGRNASRVFESVRRQPITLFRPDDRRTSSGATHPWVEVGSVVLLA